MVAVVNGSPYALWIMGAVSLYVLRRILLGPFLQGLFPSYFAGSERGPALKEQPEAKLLSDPGGSIEAAIIAILASFFMPHWFAFQITFNDLHFSVDLLVVGSLFLLEGLVTLAARRFMPPTSTRET
jgi:hypothetical protein